MNKLGRTDFRELFSAMAPQAIVNRNELALLLGTSIGAVSQMSYRGELPPTAFPLKRRSCWFVADIRGWLDGISKSREIQISALKSPQLEKTECRIGRPRNTTKKGWAK